MSKVAYEAMSSFLIPAPFLLEVYTREPALLAHDDTSIQLLHVASAKSCLTEGCWQLSVTILTSCQELISRHHVDSPLCFLQNASLLCTCFATRHLLKQTTTYCKVYKTQNIVLCDWGNVF